MKKTIFKDIPSVDKVLLEVKKNINLHDRYLKFLIYEEIDIIKEEIKNGLLEKTSKELFSRIKKGVLSRSKPNLVNIINGTGIILHTGFGRAPFNSDSLKKIAKKMEGYTNLEFNLDKGKRGEMCKIAHQLSDINIITDDNPRFENPKNIRKEILQYCPNAIEIGDRKKAIIKTIQKLISGDILLVAGKGHENSQEIKGRHLNFDDAKIIKSMIN